jgi:hypothetical protein
LELNQDLAVGSGAELMPTEQDAESTGWESRKIGWKRIGRRFAPTPNPGRRNEITGGLVEQHSDDADAA